MIEVTVNTLGLEQKILRLAAYTKKSVGEVMRQEGRLLGIQLARYTQPFGFGNDSRDQGSNAIKRDVLRAFYVLPDALCQKPTQIQTGEYAGWLRLFANQQGIVFAVEQKNFRIQESNQTLYRHHQELRNNNGIVPANRNMVTKQNRFAAINLWVITESQLASYLPFIQKEVGFAKAGWATAIDSLGGTRGLPGWVTRHKGKAPGKAIDQTQLETPTLTLVNEINYTSRVLSESGQRGAVKDAEYRLGKRIQAALDHPPQ